MSNPDEGKQAPSAHQNYARAVDFPTDKAEKIPPIGGSNYVPVIELNEWRARQEVMAEARGKLFDEEWPLAVARKAAEHGEAICRNCGTTLTIETNGLILSDGALLCGPCKVRHWARFGKGHGIGRP